MNPPASFYMRWNNSVAYAMNWSGGIDRIAISLKIMGAHIVCMAQSEYCTLPLTSAHSGLRLFTVVCVVPSVMPAWYRQLDSASFRSSALKTVSVFRTPYLDIIAENNGARRGYERTGFYEIGRKNASVFLPIRLNS